MAVRTTRTVKRGFESERSAESCRRKECAGCAAATEVSISEAFSGRMVVSLAARRMACRRRWGRTMFAAAGSDGEGGMDATDSPDLGAGVGLWTTWSWSDMVLELKYPAFTAGYEGVKAVARGKDVREKAREDGRALSGD